MKVNDWLKGWFKYDADGQFIWLIHPDGGHQKIADLRGWGAIQNLFIKKDKSIDIVEAGKFQDELGQWVTDALNEKLKQKGAKQTAEEILKDFLDKDEALDAEVTGGETYLSTLDVIILMKRFGSIK